MKTNFFVCRFVEGPCVSPCVHSMIRSTCTDTCRVEYTVLDDRRCAHSDFRLGVSHSWCVRSVYGICNDKYQTVSQNACAVKQRVFSLVLSNTSQSLKRLEIFSAGGKQREIDQRKSLRLGLLDGKLLMHQRRQRGEGQLF